MSSRLYHLEAMKMWLCLKLWLIMDMNLTLKIKQVLLNNYIFFRENSSWLCKLIRFWCDERWTLEIRCCLRTTRRIKIGSPTYIHHWVSWVACRGGRLWSWLRCLPWKKIIRRGTEAIKDEGRRGRGSPLRYYQNGGWTCHIVRWLTLNSYW
jgi:hypothetical protein